MRRGGRRSGERLLAMRFALWARTQPARLLTPELISGALDISLRHARAWARDWRLASAPPSTPPDTRPAADGHTPAKEPHA